MQNMWTFFVPVVPETPIHCHIANQTLVGLRYKVIVFNHCYHYLHSIKYYHHYHYLHNIKHNIYLYLDSIKHYIYHYLDSIKHYGDSIVLNIIIVIIISIVLNIIIVIIISIVSNIINITIIFIMIRVLCDAGFDGGLQQTFHMEVEMMMTMIKMVMMIDMMMEVVMMMMMRTVMVREKYFFEISYMNKM